MQDAVDHDAPSPSPRRRPPTGARPSSRRTPSSRGRLPGRDRRPVRHRARRAAQLQRLGRRTTPTSRTPAARCASRPARSSSTPTPRRRSEATRSEDERRAPTEGTETTTRGRPVRAGRQLRRRGRRQPDADRREVRHHARGAERRPTAGTAATTRTSRTTGASDRHPAGEDSPSSATVLSVRIRHRNGRILRTDRLTEVGPAAGRAAAPAGDALRRRCRQVPLAAPAGVVGAAERRARSGGSPPAGRPVVRRRLVGERRDGGLDAGVEAARDLALDRRASACRTRPASGPAWAASSPCRRSSRCRR